METEEKTVEQTDEVTPAVASEVSPPPQTQDLPAELTKLQGELEKVKNEAKAHQKQVFQKDAELKKFTQREDRITSIEQRIDIVAGMMADLLDKDNVETEEKPQRRSEQYLNKLKEVGASSQTQTQQVFQQEATRVYTEIEKIAKTAGLEMESDELAKAQLLFVRGKFDESLEEAKKVTEKAKPTEAEKPKEDNTLKVLQETVARLEKELKISKGELDAETGMPSGTGLPDEEWLEKEYSTGKSDDHKRAEKIIKKMSQGV